MSSHGDKPMRLFETRQGRVVDFETPEEVVRIYTCGITPYDTTHVGHAATFLAYDVVQRRLRDRGHETRCVRNITDVDDDLLARAGQIGVHYLDLAARALVTFEADMIELGLLPAWSEPRATSAISDVRAFVGRVLESGHAYELQGAVYFDISSSPGFGSLSGLDEGQMLAAAAESYGPERQADKRHPLDFVLWRPSKHGQPSWDSRWGSGRPGWHVECSTLAVRELGPRIDLHGGGEDLIFPHHECEQAQAEAATGQPFVRHWMHAAMVRKDGAKMGKASGNLVFIADLREKYDPMAIRLALISNHYRDGWEWSEDVMERAVERLDRWRARGSGRAALEEVREALDEDLDTPVAVEAMDRAVAAGAGISEAAGLLGVR